MQQQKPAFKHSLNLMDATMIVAGSMIGSGIFIVSSDITRHVGSAGWMILVWVITGVMTILAAVSYGELSSMFPKAGGQYVYLKEAYNPLVGFLYGWSFFSVIQTGTIAAVGVAFSKFTAYLFPEVGENVIMLTLGQFQISAAQVLSIAIIILLTVINSKGIRNGKIIQTFFTIVKILSLAGLILFGFMAFKSDVWTANWQNALDLHMLNADGSFSEYTMMAAFGAVAAAMVGSVFSSVAWENVTFIAGEVKNPKRNVGLSLFLGTLMVTLLYLAVNVVYLAVLPLHDIAYATNDRVAVAASLQAFGPAGTLIIAVMIMISTFGCNNGLILAGARVYYTMANDGLFFQKARRLNKHEVPEFGLWIQCIVASLLCLSGKYGDLLNMVSFVVVLFYMLTIIGIFRLRKKMPNADRPYKAPLYPVLPAIYVLISAAFCILLVFYTRDYVIGGLIIVAIGFPLYYMARKNNVLQPASSDKQQQEEG
ncbi:amino acid/polyamine/organocation transporter, APC superfamily [Arachidicoccus rhizosphaerae]|jgi:APA family basic amino acid/polyamine antiporter|uniref:Amino acid/polyamine/organocation transporter, APC superfamily n=1 Tax=Arachidicoccus rhizosphaerae TaxID=551991 RepID=A0A1H3YIU4_9BACT|nr:amino acid permease [Arachidicoccus rhizosphaerae]SEA11445.1 amino acid/polyamine/organocation transporter, APC superfamily [Arachidicoccus rhizosphaerae]